MGRVVRWELSRLDSPHRVEQALPMNMPVNTFKKAIRDGRPQIGLWCSSCSNVVAEVIAGAGFDWILIDTEHAPNEPAMVLSQLQAVEGGTAAAVVRPAWNDPVLIKRTRATTTPARWRTRAAFSF